MSLIDPRRATKTHEADLFRASSWPLRFHSQASGIISSYEDVELKTQNSELLLDRRFELSPNRINARPHHRDLAQAVGAEVARGRQVQVVIAVQKWRGWIVGARIEAHHGSGDGIRGERLLAG